MDKLVLNLSRNRHEKLRTAVRQVELCVWEWVTKNKSIRELSHCERLERMMRNLEAHKPINQSEAVTLPAINVGGVIERMPASEVWTPAVKYECLAEARAMKWLNA